MNVYIAVDIGGTQIRVAVYPQQGTKPLDQHRFPTKGKGTAMERLLSFIAELWPTEHQVLAIAAAAPGPLDPRRGILFSAPNIPGWVNLPLQQAIQERFGVPVAVGNDANMAALGEWRFGAGVGFHNQIYITISTGIGGGVILEDRLVLGEKGLAAEMGHIIISPDGPTCSCGLRGHLEAYASGTAIAKYVADQLAHGRGSSLPRDPSPNAQQIAQAANQGDPLACEAYNRAGTYLGMGLANYLHLYNPSIIILGGGVSRSGPILLEPLRKALYSNVMSPEYVKDLQIVLAALGDNAGLLGCLALAQMAQG